MGVMEALETLTSTMESVSGRKRKLEFDDTMMLLGTKLTTMIESAKDSQSLSTTMLKSNRIATALGVPEFAAQINNLGRIKQTEILQGETEELQRQKSNSLKNLYGKMKVLNEGEYVELNQLEEFRKGESLDPNLQPEYYKSVADKYRTNITRQVDFTNMNKPMLKVYAERDGEQQLVKSYAPDAQGGFFDLLTTSDTEDNLTIPTPSEVVQFQNEMTLAQERTRRSLLDDEIRAKKPTMTQVVIADEQGQPKSVSVLLYPPTKSFPFGRALEFGTGKDYTEQVTNVKPSRARVSDVIKSSDVRLGRSTRYSLQQELFTQLQTGGFFTEEVREQVAKKLNVNEDILQSGLSAFFIGQNSKFPVSSFLEALPEDFSANIKDPNISGLFSSLEEVTQHVKKLETKALQAQTEKLQQLSPDSVVLKNLRK